MLWCVLLCVVNSSNSINYPQFEASTCIFIPIQRWIEWINFLFFTVSVAFNSIWGYNVQKCCCWCNCLYFSFLVADRRFFNRFSAAHRCRRTIFLLICNFILSIMFELNIKLTHAYTGNRINASLLAIHIILLFFLCRF